MKRLFEKGFNNILQIFVIFMYNYFTKNHFNASSYLWNWLDALLYGNILPYVIMFYDMHKYI